MNKIAIIDVNVFDGTDGSVFKGEVLVERVRNFV